jgi:Fur family transcriptional regulator, ferric uptake regulator
MVAKTKEILSRHSLANTACRRDVLAVFISASHALSHHDVEGSLKEKYDRVTLYRTFQAFEEKGLIHKVVDNSGISRYALCHDNCDTHSHNDSHLHFSCTRCGRIVCVNSCAVPEVKIPDGFILEKMHVLAEGICKDCRENV